jgi:hypothetical protein
MGRSRIPRNVARVLASVAIGGIAGIGLISGDIFHTSSDVSWGQGASSQQVVQDQSSPTFTAFDVSWG